VIFRDRADAGRLLLEALRDRGLARGLVRPLCLAIPRGGVAVASPVARALAADLDVVVVRKVGAPDDPELALGAVGPAGQAVWDEALLRRLRLSPADLEPQAAAAEAEVSRRLDAYRGRRSPPELRGRDVLVIDDGLATGRTAEAALRHVRAGAPRSLVLAVPVAPAGTLDALRPLADGVLALATPEPFFAVGQFYDDFPQLTDEDVRRLL
jgi:putative phosphoribosyl transferase